MLDNAVTESLAQHLRLAQGLRRIAQGAGDLLGLLRLIDVTGHRRSKLQLFFDAANTGRDLGRKGQIGVEIGTANTAFHAHALRALAAKAEACRAIVDGPDRAGGRKSAALKALVAVHIGRQEIGVVARIFDEARHVVLHQRRHAEAVRSIEEGRLAVQRPQRLVDMSGRASSVLVPLGQERDAVALLPGNFLHRMLGDGVIVGAEHGGRVADVQLLLPGLGLALGVFHRDARVVEMVAHRAHHMLFLGGGEDVVVLVIGGDRLQIAEAGLADLVEALLEQEELQLRRHHRLKAHVLQPGHLPLQQGAGRMRHVGVGVVILHVAQHHHRALQPAEAADGGQIRLHHIVAIAARPAGRGIAFDRVHFKVRCQQIVAAMGLVIGAVDEVARVEALAHQAALHVDDTGQNRVDRTFLNGLFQGVECHVGSHLDDRSVHS